MLLNACGANFLGTGSNSGDGGSGGFKGGEQKTNGDANANNANGAGNPAVNGNDPDGWGGLRQDVAVAYGTDDQNLYVAADVYYNGDNSGDDALFKFFIQRIVPAPEKVMREMIQARGQDKSDQNRLEKVCRCGKKSTLWFFWEHMSGRRGALHSKGYDADNRLQGDWIVDHNVSDKRWYKGNLTNAPQGNATLFFGADTENPTAMLGTNSSGQGFLRTWYYHPNSIDIFATDRTPLGQP